MTDVLRVGVTGVGGGVGQSVMKALSISELPVEIHAIDIQPLSAGLYLVGRSHVLPALETPGALPQWRRHLAANGVRALIPGSDHDLAALSVAREQWPAAECNVLVSDRALVDVCRDKAATVQALRGAGLPVPDSLWDIDLDAARDWASRRFPVVLKPRDGYGSRGVQVIDDDESLVYFFSRTNKPILQEHLGHRAGAEEYTCAVFVDRDGEPVATFMARRDLSGGATYRAEIGAWPEIDKLLRRIGRTLRPRGPLNVQLRMTERGPVPFELNIRCSGTSAIRAHFGFNEPDMLLRHYVLNQTIESFVPRHGYALRYWNEVFIEGAAAVDLRRDPGAWKGELRTWP